MNHSLLGYSVAELENILALLGTEALNDEQRDLRQDILDILYTKGSRP
ncbi:hypothetical protein FDI69_gp046 [Rhodococcus phage Trina]|uniref:Uncharacterized protein n=1 Tax=Rhodococcus phage Trina TaxID=2027905 RepID=A0A2D0ZWJ1_9CAUD|nr:hypothetical protein FDI69_gp046 [Rhodococcus phage Trina]ASZ74863.1 hypothetical protein SEA_TRINA_46 [Rhodococcus phage Trina]